MLGRKRGRRGSGAAMGWQTVVHSLPLGRTLGRTSGRKSAGTATRERGGAGAFIDGTDYGPLADWIGFHLRMAQIASFQAFAREVGEVDLPPGRFALLTLIGRNPGISQTVLSRAAGTRQVHADACPARPQAPRADRAPAPRQRPAQLSPDADARRASHTASALPNAPRATTATSTASSARATSPACCASCARSCRSSADG